MIPTSFVKTVTSEVAPGDILCQRVKYSHPEGWYLSYVLLETDDVKRRSYYAVEAEARLRRMAPHLFADQLEPDNSPITCYLDGRLGPLLPVQDGLGLFFGDTEEDAVNCRSGWVFINREVATKEQVREAIDSLKQGRNDWPKKD